MGEDGEILQSTGRLVGGIRTIDCGLGVRLFSH